MKQKVTNTICNVHVSYPLIYRLPIHTHIWNNISSFFQFSSNIVIRFTSGLNEWLKLAYLQTVCLKAKYWSKSHMVLFTASTRSVCVCLSDYQTLFYPCLVLVQPKKT